MGRGLRPSRAGAGRGQGGAPRARPAGVWTACGSRDTGRRARVTSASAAGGGNMASEADLRARLQRANQEHLLRFCAELAPEPRAALLAQLEALEPEALRQHCQRAAAACARPPGPPPDLAARLQPLPLERVGSASEGDPQTRRLWEEEGRRRGSRRRAPRAAGRGHAHGAGRAGRAGKRSLELSLPSS